MKLASAIDQLQKPESADITIRGSLRDVGETLEQIAWLAATFRKPRGGQMIRSQAVLLPSSRSPADSYSCVLDLTLTAPSPVPYEKETAGSCWIPLLRHSVLACGFPIASRDEGEGLEVPAPLMMHLAGIRYPMAYAEGTIFRSRHRPDSDDFSMLVPTERLGDAIQWHFIQGNNDFFSKQNESAMLLKEDTGRNYQDGEHKSSPLTDNNKRRRTLEILLAIVVAHNTVISWLLVFPQTMPQAKVLVYQGALSIAAVLLAVLFLLLTPTSSGAPWMSSPQTPTTISTLINWYQTRDIDELVGSRAFLGFCPSAKVMIGTKSYRPEIGGSEFDQARRMFGFKREGNINVGATLTAGVPAIMRAAPTFGVNLGWEVREAQAALGGEQLGSFRVECQQAAERPLLLYDQAARNAWLVSELSVALAMTHHLLGKIGLSPDIEAQIRFAEEKDDGGEAARTAIDNCRDLVLWVEGDKELRFEHLVVIFLRLFESLVSSTKNPPLRPFKSIQAPRGWEYTDALRLSPHLQPKKLALTTRLQQAVQHVIGKRLPSWMDLAKDPNIMVLSGSGFGQVIQPDATQPLQCPSWASVPEGKDLLTASMPCWGHLTNNRAGIKLGDTKLTWHKPRHSKLFEPCQAGQPCVRIQQLCDPKTKGLTTPTAAELARRTGAVIFGDCPTRDAHLCPGPPQPPAVIKKGEWKVANLAIWLLVPLMMVAFAATRMSKPTIVI
jgi:hypothetical protein